MCVAIESPHLLSKRIVGESLLFRVRLNPLFNYQVELYTTLNREKDVYPLDRSGEVYELRFPLKRSGFFTWSIRYRREGTKSWRWLRGDDKKRYEGTVYVDPAWLDQAMVYNVFVRFFKGKTKEGSAEIRPGEGGTFDDVKAYLDTLCGMGINSLYFNPIHLIGEMHRKINTLEHIPDYWQPGSPYSIKDYKSIDPELTYDKDTKKHLLSDPQQEFRDLIEAAHERKMTVMLDLVFNHTAHDFVFQRIRPEWYLYKESITSLEDPYLYPEDLKKGKPWGDSKHTLAPYDHGLWFDDAAQLNWEYRLPPAPNKPPKNPSLGEMWEYFKSIPRYWIKHFGVDGFRCDVAYRVPTAFWKACIAEAREEAFNSPKTLYKDVVFIAESFTDDLKELQEAGFAAVYGDYSNKLRTTEDLSGYLAYIYNRSGAHFPDGSKWFIFPEGHDFDRTPVKILGDQAADGELGKLANESRWLLTATLPGIPLVFNGFEKVEWQQVSLFSYGAVNWERHNDLRDFMSHVNRIRITNKSFWLTAAFDELFVSDTDDQKHPFVYGFVRHQGTEVCLVVVNLDVRKHSGEVVLHLPEMMGNTYRLRELLTGNVYNGQGKRWHLTLKPGMGAIYRVETVSR
jgi:glycosidase